MIFKIRAQKMIYISCCDRGIWDVGDGEMYRRKLITEVTHESISGIE